MPKHIRMRDFISALDILTEPEDNPSFISDDEIQEKLIELSTLFEEYMQDPRLDRNTIIFTDCTLDHPDNPAAS